LLLSGFYETDIADLVNEGTRYGFSPVTSYERETWVSLLLQKR
jgi:hypothetical protein